MRNLFLLSLSLAVFGCNPSEKKANPLMADEPAVNAVLNDWHKAAAQADFQRYFDYFENDSAVFMGTDATERWTIGEFRPWSKPYFDAGRAWELTPVNRYVYFSHEGSTAWFDETLDTPHMGPCRGTGALVLTGEGWKITHYNLTVPIPNPMLSQVVKQIDSVLNPVNATAHP